MNILAVFSPPYLRILAQYTFGTDFPLLWKWGGAKSFDVVSGSTQAPPSQYTIILDLGRALGLLECTAGVSLHLCEEGHLEHVPDVQEMHPWLAHQQLPVCLHIQHLVVVILYGSPVELFFDSERRECEEG